MVSPVHVLMLSIQAVRGLPRLRAPGIVPGIISKMCHALYTGQKDQNFFSSCR